MKTKILAGTMSALLLTGALLPAAAAAELPADPPANVTIAARPVISPNPVISAEPQAPLTRAALITRLWELSGKPVVNFLLPFSDVTEGSASAEAIRWAASEGLTGGYGDGSFGPADPVTREQLAAIIYRYVKKFDMGFKGAWMFLMPYADRDEVREWAFEPVLWMVAGRLFDPELETLEPRKAVTAGEADGIFEKLLEKAGEQNVDFSHYGQPKA